MAVFFVNFAGIALVILSLPLTLELLLLTLASLLPQRRPRRPSRSLPVRLAVIVPAHNEELLVERCVDSLHASSIGTDTRIVVVAHNCADGTASRAERSGAEVLRFDDALAQGKGFALRRGFEYAFSQNMDAVLVVDADSTVSEGLIAVVREALSAGAEAVQCRYEMEGDSERPRTKLVALAIRGFNSVRSRGRDRLGLSAGILGSGFALRKSLLEEQPYRALSIVEDLEYHIQLVLAGKKVEFLEEAVVSSSLPLSSEGETTQRSRWEGGRIGLARIWLGPLAKRLLGGGLHLAEPILDLASLPIGYGVFLLCLGLCLPLEWLRIYSVFAIAVIAVHILAAAGTGPDFQGDLRALLRGPAYILWKLRILPSLPWGSRAAWIRTERQAASSKTI